MMEKVKKFMSRGNTSWNMVLIALLVLEFVVFGIANDRFLRPALLFTSINDNLPTFMLSLFVTLVMVTGGIDIQVSSLVGLTSITIGVAWQDFGLPIWGAVGVAFLLVTLCGAFSGFLIAYCRVQAMVVTLGGSFLYSGMALLVSTLSKTESYLGISGFPEDFRFIGTYDVFGVIPIQILIYGLMLVVAFILLHKTKYGRRVFLTGVNQSAAEYSGIHTRRVIMSTYVLSAIAAAIAGTVVTSYLGTSRSDLGGDLTMDVITAVVLGGTLNTGGKGSIIGTALASFLIAFLRFGLPLCFDVSTQYLNIPVGVLLVAVIVGRTATSGLGLGTWLRSLLPGKSGDKASTASK